jgi:hypothetical protein
MGRLPIEQIPMQMKTKAGLALVILGIGISGVWSWWKKTRNFAPVNLPISLSTGQSIISEFKLNFDGLYLIEIQAQKTVPLETLDCWMGLEVNPARCKGMPPAVAANWVLLSNGREICRGSSRNEHSAAVVSATVSRGIGEFQGQAGQEYELQVTFMADGTSLAAAHPRLKVAVASIAYADLQSARVLVFSMAFICVLFGMILVAIACYANRRRAAGAG